MFTLVPLSLQGDNVMPPVYSIISNIKAEIAGLIFYGISIALSVGLFALNSYVGHISRNGLNLSKKSILCNLRGFLLN